MRDGATDPRLGDFMPMRHPKGEPDVLMHAEVGTPEYDEAADQRRQERDAR